MNIPCAPLALSLKLVCANRWKKKFQRRQKFEGERERGTQSNYKPPKMVILDFNVLVSIFMTTYGRGQNFARIPPFIRKSMKILNIRP